MTDDRLYLLHIRECTDRPDIPWRQVAGFRNVLVHAYLGVDLERVWDVVARDLAPLRSVIDRLLAGE